MKFFTVYKNNNNNDPNDIYGGPVFTKELITSTFVISRV